MQRLVNAVLIVCLLLSLSWLAGCQARSAAVVPVSGKVTLDGQPLVGATINFQPLTDKTAAAQAGTGSYAKTDDQGRFTLRLIDPDQPGALVGKHTVTFTTAVAADPASDELKLKQPERLSEESRTQEFEVPPGGTDQANFTLHSK